jgi:putative aldouronate transport system substrate-binding protein
MKKKLALILSILLIFAVFAGCGEKTGETPTAEVTQGTTAEPSGSDEPTPTEESSPYSFAAGKYDVDEKGFPTGAYEYQLPLSTVEDEVLTFWMTCYTPQAIPEDGFGSMPYQTMLRETTGVNIEYVNVANDARSENFSVMLSSDDLCDIISAFSFYYTGTPMSAVEEGYIANLYDYKDYMPNFMYQAVRFDDIDVYNTIMFNESTVLWFLSMLEDPMVGMNYCTRGDWLTELGIDPASIVTYDDVHNMLSRFKTELNVQWPMQICKTIEFAASQIFAGYDTALYVSPTALPVAKVVDGVPTFTLTQPEDLEALELLTAWYEEGLIDPAWTGTSTNQDIAAQITTGVTGYVPFNPGEIKGFEDASSDPDAEWVALTKVRKTPGQAFKMGSKLGHFSYGSDAISATCANIPLAVTYCDYFYSPSGSFTASYGVEGYTYTLNENGEPQLTDFVLNNPDQLGVAWVMIMNAINSFVDPGIDWHVKSYAYPGGERLLNMMKVTWAEPNYSGEYDWPSSLKFTDDQNAELAALRADAITYLNENFLGFVDGSKPLSEWDAYVQGVNDIALTECQVIYQEAYNAFIAKIPA